MELNCFKINNMWMFDVVLNMGEMVKFVELIEVKGVFRLMLVDWWLFNVLLCYVFGFDLVLENWCFEIVVVDLREMYESNDWFV